MVHNAALAYEDAARTAASSRELEANVLFKAARKLEACQRGWDHPDRSERLEEALRYNQRIWTFFQSELARPDHPLDPQQRLNLLTISAFIDRRTFEILANPVKEMLQHLIDINRNLGAGLSEKPDRSPAGAASGS